MASVSTCSKCVKSDFLGLGYDPVHHGVADSLLPALFESLVDGVFVPV